MFEYALDWEEEEKFAYVVVYVLAALMAIGLEIVGEGSLGAATNANGTFSLSSCGSGVIDALCDGKLNHFL